MVRTFLHDEMVAILVDNGGGWMAAAEIADLVNVRGAYQRTLRAKTLDVEAGQILLRAWKRPNMFEINGRQVRLKRAGAGNEDKTA